MDGNKDEALKCMKIGRRALETGDRNRAIKFVAKARRLDPTLSVEVDDLLSAIGKLQSHSHDHQSPSPSSPRTKPSGRSWVRHRGSGHSVRPSSSSTSSSSSSVAYTEEQLSMVRQIRKKKDYYELLGLEKTCSVEEVRKAYRKLSLKVHPDKNGAPGAEEAFKAVSRAFQCLSDKESRKRYELVGSEEDEVVRERRAAGHGCSNGFYAADVDAEEIFRNFFFGGMPVATAQFTGFGFGTGMGARTRTGGGDHGSAGSNLRALVQLLPVFLVLLFNFLPSREPMYALSRTYPYEYPSVTPKGINYYVRTANFDQKYPPNTPERLSLERQVETDHYAIVLQNCQNEMQRYRWGYVKETPYCDMLKRHESMA